jgi:ABC-type multidrug transport system ATPase subunit
VIPVADGLIVRRDPGSREWRFDGSRPVRVGRDPSNDVVIEDTRVSRDHALIEPGPDGRWVLVDCSSNGTFFAGARLDRLPLQKAITVHLGNATDGAGLLLIPPQRTVGEPSPSTPFGSFSQVYQPERTTRLGRAPDNDIVVEDLLVSRHHAELRSERDGRRMIVDLGSYNGTFLDGRRVERAPVTDGSTITLGHHSFVLRDGRLVEYIDDGRVTFSARHLGVTVDGRTLLEDVSLWFGPGSFSAILGPTGAGKSTLLKALTGSRPADRGQVLYNGRDLYGAFGELRDRIGYVPQDDVLHAQLTVRQALRYSAQLRFPADVSAADREARVERVLAQLGLAERADLAIERLSGGQRKRTNVALELLSEPSLLLLDEPTSGLDPGYEKSVMELLRSIADDGRTVLTVTHSVQSLDDCDRVLFLAPGGQTAFFGPPQEALGFFGQSDYADVFRHLDAAPAGAAHATFAGSPADRDYVQAPLQQDPVAPASAGPPKAAPTSIWSHQLRTLVHRYAAVIAADRRNLLLLLAQAPVLAILILAVTGHNSLVFPPTRLSTKGSTLLIALVLGATYLGAGNSIREVVKERALLERERAVGLSPVAYVLSKVVVLGGLTVVQALILDVVGTLRAGGPAHGALLGSGKIELFVVLAGAGLAAMALGLVISAFATNADKALTLLPVLLFVQFLLSGSLFNLQHTPVLKQLGFLTSAKWGYSAAASTANLEGIEGGCPHPVGPLGAGASIATCDATFGHSAGQWLTDMVWVGALTVVPIGGAVLAVRRVGRPRKD